jgi:hypothetical protein
MTQKPLVPAVAIAYGVKKDMSLHEFRRQIDWISRDHPEVLSIRAFARGSDTLEITFVCRAVFEAFIRRFPKDKLTGMYETDLFRTIELKDFDILTLPNGDELLAHPTTLALEREKMGEIERLKARIAELEAELGTRPLKKKPRIADA